MDRSLPDDERQSQILSAFLRKSARSGKLYSQGGEEEPEQKPAARPADKAVEQPAARPVSEPAAVSPPEAPLPPDIEPLPPKSPAARGKSDIPAEPPVPETPPRGEVPLPEVEEYVCSRPIELDELDDALPADETPEPVSVTFPPPIDIDQWITPVKKPAKPAKHPSKGASKSSSRDDLVVVSDLHKGYIKGKVNIPVLRGVSFSVAEGEYLSIVGQSGSGKSTLLHLMGTLDIPDSGTVHFDGQRIDNLPTRQRDLLRNRYIGMIFQFYHLIPEMTMIENVLAPLMIRDSVFGYLTARRAFRKRAKELLEMVGLGHRIHHKPNELSGGEMQRTAIARALITEPRILLADEPTGNLDSKTSAEIVKLLRSLNEQRRLTIIMVTHDTAQAEEADRYIRLVDGQIAETVQRKG